PIFLPIFSTIGVDLIWIGIATIIAVEIGLLTPPLGIACFVVKDALAESDVSLEDVFVGVIPFIGAMSLTLFLLLLLQ
ncbi:MAG: TRAP transporter large permease subunit, partial [Pseudomonadota bacterium]